MKSFIKNHPFWFSIIIFIFTLVIPLPFVFAFNKLGMENLRLILPIVESIFIVGLIYSLGWLKATGFGKRIQNIHVLWLPTLLIFVPVALFGTVEIAANATFFYILALLFTGISEEGFARGLLLKTLIPKGKWIALLFMALLFSVGHFTNLFFEDFSALDMMMKLFVTFSFAIFFGALFLRTLNIWPLIIIHMLWDFSFVISGTAGPFTVTPFPSSIHLIIGAISIIYAIIIVRKISDSQILKEMNVK